MGRSWCGGGGGGCDCGCGGGMVISTFVVSLKLSGGNFYTNDHFIL